MNWTAFDNISKLREQQLQEANVQKQIATKNSGHQDCNFYFDARLKGHVFWADHAIFDKFGYQSCCSSDNV